MILIEWKEIVHALASGAVVSLVCGVLANPLSLSRGEFQQHFYNSAYSLLPIHKLLKHMVLP